jgi:ubiquinone/menaquinone biosynthesis C-methylase UbiE
MNAGNQDKTTVDGFGDEWSRFDQSSLSTEELQKLFDEYFHIFPWDTLPENPVGMDIGCGSGRWAQLVAPRVNTLHCVDASAEALAVAEKNLSNYYNHCQFHHASVDALPVADNTMDFAYSLGVLHHIPDTLHGLQACVKKLKPGAPFLLYLYYNFDNRPSWYRLIWKATDIFRKVISRLPHPLRYGVSQIIAATVYYPLARGSLLLEQVGINVTSIPLSDYRHLSFYTMRTDALDRFGTAIEKRFSQQDIREMMEASGLSEIRFSDTVPYWCAVGIRRE